MKTFMRKIVVFINDEEGAAAIEYALLLAMITLGILGVAYGIGPKIKAIFNAVDTGLSHVAPW